MSFIEKITGKSKFVLSLMLILLVAVNRWKGLGLTEQDWNMILWFAGIALGADAAEGMVAKWVDGKTPAPPAPPKG